MIAESVLQTIEHTSVFSETGSVVVAVSGGCDSVALLHVLHSLQARLEVDLHVASLDHGIRGEAGQHDVNFVRSLAQRWKLPYTAQRAEVPKLAREWGIGLEAAARRARYDFLACVARQQGSSCVAVGHHAQDQAETMLMHIVRGSGARGLGGMRTISPMPFHPAITLFRPLLSLAREQLEAYCAAHNLAYRHDETNEDTTFRRNYLRHEILERLERLNPDMLGAFGRLAESIAVDEDFFAELLETQLMPAVDKFEGVWRIGKQAFFEMHPALQRRLLREAFRRLGDEFTGLSHHVTLDLITWAKSARPGTKRDGGASIELYMDYDDLWILRKGSQMMQSDYRLIPRDTDASITPSAPYKRHGLSISIADSSTSFSHSNDVVLKAECDVRLRTRRPGDRFKPKGMGGQSRKLKNWMIDRKVPRYVRDRIPLVTADGDVIAICLGETWHLAETDPAAASEVPSYVLNLL